MKIDKNNHNHNNLSFVRISYHFEGIPLTWYSMGAYKYSKYIQIHKNKYIQMSLQGIWSKSLQMCTQTNKNSWTQTWKTSNNFKWRSCQNEPTSPNGRSQTADTAEFFECRPTRNKRPSQATLACSRAYIVCQIDTGAGIFPAFEHCRFVSCPKWIWHLAVCQWLPKCHRCCLEYHRLRSPEEIEWKYSIK